ncbi:hypothetical protein KUCAC02_025156, partial [Chaenocephalus aceratus]
LELKIDQWLPGAETPGGRLLLCRQTPAQTEPQSTLQWKYDHHDVLYYSVCFVYMFT